MASREIYLRIFHSFALCADFKKREFTRAWVISLVIVTFGIRHSQQRRTCRCDCAHNTAGNSMLLFGSGTTKLVTDGQSKSLYEGIRKELLFRLTVGL